MALDAWQETHGGGKKAAPLTHEELEDLMEKFPDGN